MNLIKAGNHRLWTYLTVLLCLFIFVSCSSKERTPIDLERNSKQEARDGTGEQTASLAEPKGGKQEEESGQKPAASGQSSDTQPENITVYVCGAVVQPGLYTLSAEARMMDAVNAAGGMTPQADQNLLNLAQFMTDGQMVRIPLIGEEPAQDAGSVQADGPGQAAQEERIDLNHADVQQLMSIPGVGQSKAEAIIQYREENGKFGCIEDIMKVNGIKEGSFKKMEPYICVK